MDWFLYDNDLRHERVKFEILFAIRTSLCTDDKYSFWSSGMTINGDAKKWLWKAMQL